MSDTTIVQFGALQSGADAIGASFSALNNTLTNLDAQLQPMVGSWSGQARDAYYVQKQQWTEAAQAMATILGQMGQAVSTAHQNYQAAEQTNTARWS